MVGKTKSATKAQRDYQQILRNSGCVCCRQIGEYRPAEIHHIVEGRKRLGQHYVVPLCDWHHRAVPPGDMRPSEATDLLGPSLANGKRPFVERWGTEKELQILAEEFAQALAGELRGLPF